MKNETKSREQQIEVIAKIIRHAESAKGFGSIAEADHFMAHAMKLMTEWNIAQHEIYLKETQAITIVSETTQCKFDYYGEWEAKLAHNIAKYFFTKTYMTSRRPGWSGWDGTKHAAHPGSVTFMGTSVNVQAVSYIFDFYRNVCNELAWSEYGQAKKSGAKMYRVMRNLPVDEKVPEQDLITAGLIPNARKFVLSFYAGAVVGIRTKLNEEFKRATSNMSVVPSYNVEIEGFEKEQGLNLRISKASKTTIDNGAYEKGVKAGSELKVNKGVR